MSTQVVKHSPASTLDSIHSLAQPGMSRAPKTNPKPYYVNQETTNRAWKAKTTHKILDPECHNRALPGKQEVVFICECVSGNPHVQIFKHYSCEKNRRYNLSAHTQSHMHAHALSTILWVKAPSPICFINPNSPLHNWTKCSQEWKSTTTLPASCACVCARLCVCAPGLCVRAQVGDECDREK